MFLQWRHSQTDLTCYSLVWRDLLYPQQWFSVVEFTKSLYPVRVSCFSPGAGPSTGLKIRDICHLTTVTVILPLGFHKEQKNVCSFFFFLSQSIFGGRRFLRRFFWATLNTVFCMMSKTLAKRWTEMMLAKVADHCSEYKLLMCSGFAIICYIMGW